MGHGRVTTHVLDTARGMPAAHIVIDVCRMDGSERTVLKQVQTNSDGRTDQPVLSGDDFVSGVYELGFHAGDYLRAAGVDAESPLFLDVIPIRFGVADANQHFHVPLLLSPYGYSTYRGS